MPDTLIGIIGMLVMVLCLVVIWYQHRRMSHEYAARDAAGQRTE